MLIESQRHISDTAISRTDLIVRDDAVLRIPVSKESERWTLIFNGSLVVRMYLPVEDHHQAADWPPEHYEDIPLSRNSEFTLKCLIIGNAEIRLGATSSESTGILDTVLIRKPRRLKSPAEITNEPVDDEVACDLGISFATLLNEGLMQLWVGHRADERLRHVNKLVWSYDEPDSDHRAPFLYSGIKPYCETMDDE